MPVFLVMKIWNSVKEKSLKSQGILLCYALLKPCSWIFISFSYGQLHVLVTDFHSYPHGPSGLLKFRIVVLFLEATPCHRIIRPTYMLYCFFIFETVCVYTSFSMNICGM